MLKFNWSTSWYSTSLSSKPWPVFYRTTMSRSTKCQKEITLMQSVAVSPLHWNTAVFPTGQSCCKRMVFKRPALDTHFPWHFQRSSCLDTLCCGTEESTREAWQPGEWGSNYSQTRISFIWSDVRVFDDLLCHYI